MSPTSSAPRRRTAAIAAILILVPAILLGLGAAVAHLRGTYISSDSTLITPYRLKEIADTSWPAHIIAGISPPSPDEPDRLLTYADREVALLQIRQGQRHVLWEGMTSDRRPWPVSLDDHQPSDHVTAQRWDSMGCRLVVMTDHYEVKREFERVATVDRDGNGRPGVGLCQAGMIDFPGSRRLIAGVMNDRDLDPRGVAAFDDETGRLLWLYRTAQDPQMIVLQDLIGDERPEIILAGRAPSNGAKIGPRTDSVCCLALLDADGNEIWYREDGAEMDNSHLLAGTFTRDREQRIIWMTVTQSAKVKPSTVIRVIDPASGNELLSRTFPGTSSGIFRLDATGDGIDEIVFGSSTGFLRALDIRLETVRNAQYPTSISIVGLRDLTGDEKPEMIVLAGRNLSVFDFDHSGLRLLASTRIVGLWIPQQQTGAGGEVVALGGPDGKTYLATVEANNRLSVFSFEPRGLMGAPPPAIGLGILATLLLAATLVSTLLGRRIFGGGDPAPAVTAPTLSPEIVKTLHREVSEMIHAIDRTNPLVRIQQLFSFVQGGGGMTPQVRERIDDATEALLAEGEPGLVRLVDQVGPARDELPELASLERCYRDLTSTLRDLRDSGFPQTEIERQASAVAASATKAQEALRALRDQLRSRLSANLQTTLARVLESLQPEAREVEIQRIEISSSYPHAVRVLCDEGELFTVLSNLISNAIREMRGRPERRISLRIDPHDDAVDLFIDDTGSGIAKERWETIFGPAGSTTGGGFGLPHARRVLQQYKGWIEVASSEVGKGTSMQLTFQMARRFREDRVAGEGV